MEPIYQKPMDIEARSMAIIEEHLTGVTLPEPERSILKRVIHTTADFDYTENLCFSENAVSSALEALQRGAHIVTDTNMALAGLSKPSLAALGSTAYCFMADPQVAKAAKQNGTTRAAAAMEYAAQRCPGAVFAIGNAPTALLALGDLLEQDKLRPALIIAVPVGFVNVVESKERLFSICLEKKVPCIAAMGRKGGSTVAAAICNALLYTATGRLDPAARGWQG